MVEDTLLMYSRMANEYKRQTIKAWMKEFNLNSEPNIRNEWITGGKIPKKK